MSKEREKKWSITKKNWRNSNAPRETNKWNKQLSYDNLCKKLIAISMITLPSSSSTNFWFAQAFSPDFAVRLQVVSFLKSFTLFWLWSHLSCLFLLRSSCVKHYKQAFGSPLFRHSRSYWDIPISILCSFSKLLLAIVWFLHEVKVILLLPSWFVTTFQACWPSTWSVQACSFFCLRLHEAFFLLILASFISPCTMSEGCYSHLLVFQALRISYASLASS